MVIFKCVSCLLKTSLPIKAIILFIQTDLRMQNVHKHKLMILNVLLNEC